MKPWILVSDSAYVLYVHFSVCFRSHNVVRINFTKMIEFSVCNQPSMPQQYQKLFSKMFRQNKSNILRWTAEKAGIESAKWTCLQFVYSSDQIFVPFINVSKLLQHILEALCGRRERSLLGTSGVSVMRLQIFLSQKINKQIHSYVHCVSKNFTPFLFVL